MGEYEQPVVGMKSCFDYSETDGGAFKAWSGREWFLVRKAEIQVSASNVLIPYVKMGVEAREQVVCGNSLEDKQITRQDHPLVKYAEAFTKNFDLIAERKSVINQLRELAKASVLARHLVDAGVKLDDAWYHLAENEFACSLEVPQLWNERLHSQVHVQDGAIVRDRDRKSSRMHGVYGGVAFGLDKFQLSSTTARTVPAAGKLTPLTTRVSRQVPSAAISVAGKLGLGVARTSVVTSAALVGRKGYAPGTEVMLTFIEQRPELNGQKATIVKFEGGDDRRYEVLIAGTERVSLRESKLAPLPGAEAVAAVPADAAPAPQASVTTGKLPMPARAAPSLRIEAQEASTVAVAAGSQPVEPASGVDKFSLLTGGERPRPVTAAISRIKPLQVSVAPQASIAASLPQRAVTSSVSQKVSTAPISSVASMVSGAAFAPPALTAPSEKREVGAVGAAKVDPRPLLGVDLRLDHFDLSSSKRVSLEAQAGSWHGDAKPLGECRTLGKAFWGRLDDGSEDFDKGDHELLNAIFNPELSDRRSEGDIFVPPDASYANVTRLRALVNEEDKVRQRRKEHFFSKDFAVDSPGTCFPASWTPSVEVARGDVLAQAGDGRRKSSMRSRPEYCKGEAAALLQEVLSTVTPTFDKLTEDGERFLIYQVGSLEVRTTQDVFGKENIGAVFSRFLQVDAEDAKISQKISGQEQIVKATMYVERACVILLNAPNFSFHYYVVLETEKGRMIVTERLSDGQVSWNEDAADVQDRNSLAKVMHSTDRSPQITVNDIRIRQSSEATKVAQTSKRYAKTLFSFSTPPCKQR